MDNKRTPEEAQKRGNIKSKLKSITFQHIDKTLLSPKERGMVREVEYNIIKLVQDFDKNTAQLGFNVYKYDIEINDPNWLKDIKVEKGISYSKLKWLKKQKIKLKILNTYKL